MREWEREIESARRKSRNVIFFPFWEIHDLPVTCCCYCRRCMLYCSCLTASLSHCFAIVYACVSYISPVADPLHSLSLFPANISSTRFVVTVTLVDQHSPPSFRHLLLVSCNWLCISWEQQSCLMSHLHLNSAPGIPNANSSHTHTHTLSLFPNRGTKYATIIQRQWKGMRSWNSCKCNNFALSEWRNSHH